MAMETLPRASWLPSASPGVLHGEKRVLDWIVQDGDSEVFKELGPALNEIDMPVGRRVEGAGIEGFHAHRAAVWILAVAAVRVRPQRKTAPTGSRFSGRSVRLVPARAYGFFGFGGAGGGHCGDFRNRGGADAELLAEFGVDFGEDVLVFLQEGAVFSRP